MLRNIVQFIFGVICGIIGFALGKFDIAVFSIMANMLKDGVMLNTYNLAILLGLLSLFCIVLFVLLIPLLCGIYLIGDLFGFTFEDI